MNIRRKKARTNADLVRRLVHQIEITEQGCWEWQGMRQPFGYGMVSAYGRPISTHRLSWWLRHGDPGGLHVLHRCDNPPCCNPAHLFLGTNLDNIRDRVAKGRSGKTNNRKGKPSQLTGELHPAARLTASQVLEIRARADAGELHRVLGAEYGICRRHVSDIVARKKWKNVA